MALKHVFVTAFINMRDEENNSNYMQLAAKETLRLESTLVIICERKNYETISQIRGDSFPTQYIFLEKEDLPIYQKYKGKYRINCTKNLAVPVWLSKPFFINTAIKSTQFFIDENTIWTWYDFGIVKCRRIQADLKIDQRIVEHFGSKMKLCCIGYERKGYSHKLLIEEYCSVVAGGFISGKQDHWQEIEELFESKCQETIKLGFLPYEENILSQKLVQDPDYFDICIVRCWTTLDIDYHCPSFNDFSLITDLRKYGLKRLEEKYLDYIKRFSPLLHKFIS